MDIAATIVEWTPLAAAVLVGAAGIAMRMIDNANLQNRPEPYFASATSAALVGAYTITSSQHGAATAGEAALTAALAIGGVALMAATLKIRMTTHDRTPHDTR